MKRNLSHVAAVLMLVLVNRSGFSQEMPSVPADRLSAGVVLDRAFFPGDLSVVGSDGTYYRVRHDLGPISLPVGPAVVPPPPSSILEAIDLNPNSKGPVDAIAFAGLGSHLGIGKDNRLYLVVNITPPVSIASDSAKLVPVPAPQSRLYVIPTPFPPRALGATLESIAVPASLEALTDAMAEGIRSLDVVVQADFEGHAQSLKVKAVGEAEFLYVSVLIPSYRFPTLTNTGDVGSQFRLIKPPAKVLVFTNEGRKIKEVGTN